MMRLIKKGLMFGNLVPVTSPIWVQRYNRALKRLTGRETALDHFHIDISGFSPEVAEELDDPLYLNPNGVNRMFILLTPDQKRAPLLDAKFSMTRDIIRDFISRNEAQIFALTTGDALAGELVNSVFAADHPNDLLDITQIEVEADTVGDTLARAGELSKKIDRFLTSKNGWQDDVLIAQMIGLAKETGDVVRNPVELTGKVQRVDHFWTAHFGGAFFFRGDDDTVVIANDPDHFKDMTGAIVLGLDDAEAIAKFLFSNALVDPLLTKKGPQGAAIIQRKMDMIVAYTAALRGAEHLPQDTRALRRLARTYARDLPFAYRGLADLHRWAAGRGKWPKITAIHPSYFYSLRATPGPAHELVNRLLAALTPMDMRQLFICHKEAFYPAYAKWPEPLKDFTADLLETEYQSDKPALRDALFGAFEEEEAQEQSLDARVASVGPWGAVRRSR